MRHSILILPLSLAVIGCATDGENAPPPSASAPPQEPLRPPPGPCDASAVQTYVGQQATGGIGEAILAASRAKMLRWGPPNSMWTMDYREDRVNVRYDERMMITAVTCG